MKRLNQHSLTADAVEISHSPAPYHFKSHKPYLQPYVAPPTTAFTDLELRCEDQDFSGTANAI